VSCVIGEGDSDDMSAGSSVSRESSPSASPFQSHHQTLVASLSAVELDRAVDEDSASKLVKIDGHDVMAVMLLR